MMVVVMRKNLPAFLRGNLLAIFWLHPAPGSAFTPKPISQCSLRTALDLVQ